MDAEQFTAVEVLKDRISLTSTSTSMYTTTKRLLLALLDIHQSKYCL